MFNSRKLVILSLFLFATPLCCFTFPGNLTAQTKGNISEVPNSEAPNFTISEGISEGIYNDSTSTISSKSEDNLTIDSSLRIFFPSDFSLKNKYFNVPYGKNTSNIVGVLVGPQLNLASFDFADVATNLRAGYAYSQGIYEVESESGLDVRDTVELQWIPIQSGLEVTSKPFFSNRITAGLFSGVGIDWFTQSGELDGMNQTFWVPRFEFGASATLIDRSTSKASGFDGIRLSGASYQSFASSQTNRGWAADIGARYAF